MDHFLDQALCGLETLAALCREGHSIEPSVLDKLNGQAELAIQFLTGSHDEESQLLRERFLQFLLGIANLHEYLSHHVSLVGKPN